MGDEERFDILAFGAHPDDVELGCGGVLCKMVRTGYRVGIVDLTRGEMGTRGSPEIRAKEAAAAAAVIGAKVRENLDLPDGSLPVAMPARLVEVIRKYRPFIVVAPFRDDRHPDHQRAGELVTEACYKAGLKKYDAGFEAYRPPWLVYYMQHHEFEPSFVVDISDDFKNKIEAVTAYRSQTHNPEYKKERKEAETLISSEYFLTMIETRARYYGSRIGVEFGEPFWMQPVMGIGDPVSFFASWKNIRTL